MRLLRSRRLLFAGIFGLAVLVVAGDSARAQAGKPLVEEVVVIGYRRLAREEILKHISTRAGDTFNENQVRRDFQSVLELGQVDRLHARVSTEPGVRGGVVVIFDVYELPLIASVKFRGLPEGVSESEIVRALAAARVNIVKDASFDSGQVRKAMRIIAECLTSHGWLDAGVDLTSEFSDTQSVVLTFEISLRF